MGNGAESPAKASTFLGAVGDRGRFLASTGSEREPVVCCGSTPVALFGTKHLAAHRTRRTDSPSPPGALTRQHHETRGMNQTICTGTPDSRPANYWHINGPSAAAVPEYNRNMLRVAIIGAQWKRSTVPISPVNRKVKRRRPIAVPDINSHSVRMKALIGDAAERRLPPAASVTGALAR